MVVRDAAGRALQVVELSVPVHRAYFAPDGRHLFAEVGPERTLVLRLGPDAAAVTELSRLDRAADGRPPDAALLRRGEVLTKLGRYAEAKADFAAAARITRPKEDAP